MEVVFFRGEDEGDRSSEDLGSIAAPIGIA